MIVWAWAVGLVFLAWLQRERTGVLIALAGAAFIYFLMYDAKGEAIAIALGGHGGEITLLAIPAAFVAASMRKKIGAVPEAEEEV